MKLIEMRRNYDIFKLTQPPQFFHESTENFLTLAHQ